MLKSLIRGAHARAGRTPAAILSLEIEDAGARPPDEGVAADAEHRFNFGEIVICWLSHGQTPLSQIIAPLRIVTWRYR
jgi:hypothetical protein